MGKLCGLFELIFCLLDYLKISTILLLLFSDSIQYSAFKFQLQTFEWILEGQCAL